MIYKFIINFQPYFLIISLNHSVMECGHGCPVVFYRVVFFCSESYAGEFHDINKMGQIRKNSMQEMVCKVRYFLFNLIIIQFFEFKLNKLKTEHKQTSIINSLLLWCMNALSLTSNAQFNELHNCNEQCAVRQHSHQSLHLHLSYVASSDLWIQFP